MSKDIESIFEILDSLSQPAMLVAEEGSCIYANKSIFRLANIDFYNSKEFQIFWPSFVKELNSPEDFNTHFFLQKESRLSVRLRTSKLSSENYLVLVLNSGPTGYEDSDYFHSQRLETLGRLAGSVAHDFNNILAGVLGHVTYLKTILPGSGKHTASLGAIQEGGAKAAQLTSQILNFSRLNTESSESAIDVSRVIYNSSELVRAGLPPSIDFILSIESEQLRVRCIEARIAQILVNLVTNAADAVEGNHGIVKVFLGAKSSSELGSAYQDDFPYGAAVLGVRDNGSGIPAELLPKITAPFFSTKKDKGTGMGLSTVSSIVRDMNGRLKIASEPGRGTQVDIFLPLDKIDAEEDSQINEPSEEVSIPGGSERILIVDDELHVREVLGMNLAHIGYNVSEASSGVQALDLYKSSRGKYNLVILDMLMPYMSGLELFEALKEIDSEVKVIAMSGFSSESDVQKILSNGGLDFIAKPFTIDSLAHTVRACLDL